MEEPRQCAKCKFWYPKTPECFDRDATGPSGLQSYCVECKDDWDAQENGILRRCHNFLLNDEPRALAAWNETQGGFEGEFLRKLSDQGGVCRHCGAGLREWQKSGHNLDRVDNKDKTLHTPQNTVLVCAPCNMTRGRMNYHAWREHVAGIVNAHGWGRVPWGEINPKYTRIVRRTCRHLAVTPPQLPLFPGSKPGKPGKSGGKS